MTTSHGDGDQEIYGDYSVHHEDQPGSTDDLRRDDGDDDLDRGRPPRERYSAGQRYGNTPWEGRHREASRQRADPAAPARASARTRRRTSAATTSASTARARPPRRRRCTSWRTSATSDRGTAGPTSG